jgi:hypothetical protein
MDEFVCYQNLLKQNNYIKNRVKTVMSPGLEDKRIFGDICQNSKYFEN